MDATTMIRLVGTTFSILSSLFVVVIFCVVKFNDLKHIDAKLQELSNKYDNMSDNYADLSSKISNIDGYIKGQNDKRKRKGKI